METVVKTIDEVNEKVARETLFAYLDKGIDDMEAGRMHTVDEAFEIIRERMLLHQNFIFYPERKKGDCIILELKVDSTPEDAIAQIKDKDYAMRFKGRLGENPKYAGRILAVGISYCKGTKVHHCKIEVLE